MWLKKDEEFTLHVNVSSGSHLNVIWGNETVDCGNLGDPTLPPELDPAVVGAAIETDTSKPCVFPFR